MTIRTMLLCVGALAITLTLGSAAMAQDAPDTTYDFDDDEVLGGYHSPYVESILVHRRGPRASLVRPRLHFVPELMKSVETI